MTRTQAGGTKRELKVTLHGRSLLRSADSATAHSEDPVGFCCASAVLQPSHSQVAPIYGGLTSMLNVFQPLDTLRNGLRSHLAAVHTSANTSLQNFRKSWPSAMTDSGEHQQQANGIGFASASGSPSAGGGTPLPRLARLSSASLRRRTGCFLIGIAGGTASGKTTVCHKIMDRLQVRR
jgi:pantothenate kinase